MISTTRRAGRLYAPLICMLSQAILAAPASQPSCIERRVDELNLSLCAQADAVLSWLVSIGGSRVAQGELRLSNTDSERQRPSNQTGFVIPVDGLDSYLIQIATRRGGRQRSGEDLRASTISLRYGTWDRSLLRQCGELEFSNYHSPCWTFHSGWHEVGTLIWRH